MFIDLRKRSIADPTVAVLARAMISLFRFLMRSRWAGATRRLLVPRSLMRLPGMQNSPPQPRCASPACWNRDPIFAHQRERSRSRRRPSFGCRIRIGASSMDAWAELHMGRGRARFRLGRLRLMPAHSIGRGASSRRLRSAAERRSCHRLERITHRAWRVQGPKGDRPAVTHGRHDDRRRPDRSRSERYVGGIRQLFRLLSRRCGKPRCLLQSKQAQPALHRRLPRDA